MYKTLHSRTTFGSWDVEKVHAVVARSTFPSQKCKELTGSEHTRTFRCRFAWSAQAIVHLVKSEQNVRFCGSFKNDGRRGAFEEDLQRCIFRGRHSTRDMSIRDARRSGCWCPDTGCIFEHQIFRFAKVILRDRCSTSYDLASLLRRRYNTSETWAGKIAKRIGCEAICSELNFPFLKEVSQNCFVLDVANFKNWGRLAELRRRLA